jgi:hypothetical protein
MYLQVRPVLGCRLVGDEYVIVFEQTGRDRSLVLNPAAARAFALMDGRHSLSEIAEVIASDRQVTAESSLRDLRQLVTHLERAGIVASQAKPWATPCPLRLQSVPRPIVPPEAPGIVEEEYLAVRAGLTISGVDPGCCGGSSPTGLKAARPMRRLPTK